MDLTVLDEAMSALRTAGFKTRRAYYGTGVPTITQVVAVVQLAEANFTEKRLSLEAMILGPQSLGGSACEDAAITAAQALTAVGFSCKVGSVKFDGGMGVFCVSCIATVQEPEPEEVIPEKSENIPFKIDSAVQNWVVSFTAQLQIEGQDTELGDSPWRIRLEQFFPTGVEEDGDPSTGIGFVVTSGEESYGTCRWTSFKRTIEADGLRFIREGTAERRIS